MSGQVIPNEVRVSIRAGLIAQGIPSQHVDEIVDLGVHAAEEARNALLRAIDRASNPQVFTTALGVAIAVALADLSMLQSAMIEAATDSGLPVKNFTVGAAQ